MTKEFYLSSRLEKRDLPIDFDGSGPRTCHLLDLFLETRTDLYWNVAVDPPIPGPDGLALETVVVSSRGGFVIEGPEGPEVALRSERYLRVAIEVPTVTRWFRVMGEIALRKDDLPPGWPD